MTTWNNANTILVRSNKMVLAIFYISYTCVISDLHRNKNEKECHMSNAFTYDILFCDCCK